VLFHTAGGPAHRPAPQMSRAHLGKMQEHQQSAGPGVPRDWRQLRHRQGDGEGAGQAKSDGDYGLQGCTKCEKCHNGNTQQDSYRRIGNISLVEPAECQIIKFHFFLLVNFYLNKTFLTKEKNLRQVHKNYVVFIKNNFSPRK